MKAPPPASLPVVTEPEPEPEPEPQPEPEPEPEDEEDLIKALEEAADLFDEIDADGSGDIEMCELEAALQSLGLSADKVRADMCCLWIHLSNWLGIHLSDWLCNHLSDWLGIHLSNWLCNHLSDWLGIHLSNWPGIDC